MRAYVAAEPGHQELERLLLRGDDDVMTSALSRVELGSAMTRARHERRLRRWRNVLERFDADCLEEGPITLLVLEADAPLRRAYELAIDHRLRALDAIHLAVALEEQVGAFVTRDARQAEAAAALGLAVR